MVLQDVAEFGDTDFNKMLKLKFGSRGDLIQSPDMLIRKPTLQRTLGLHMQEESDTQEDGHEQVKKRPRRTQNGYNLDLSSQQFKEMKPHHSSQCVVLHYSSPSRLVLSLCSPGTLLPRSQQYPSGLHWSPLITKIIICNYVFLGDIPSSE